MEKKCKDFVFSVVLTVLGIYVTVEGYRIYAYAAKPPYRIEQLSISPGFLPIILGVLLFVLSLVMMVKSLQDGGIRTRFAELKSWAGPTFRNKNVHSMAIGIVIMAVYTYLLMGFLPFWASTFIFLAGLMFYLRAGKWWKIIAVSAGSIILVILLFEVCFNAALP